MNQHGHAHPHTAVPVTGGRTIRWASHYDLLVKLLRFGSEKKLREETIRQAAIPADAEVLDVGCGTGTLTLLAKTYVGNQGSVFGVDASPEMIQVAQQKAIQQKSDVNVQPGIIETLPFPDGTFDVVLSSLMFHHLPEDLKRRGRAEIYRVLKPGGRLLIVDMQRPTSFIQHLLMFFMFHGGVTHVVQDLSPVL